MRDSQSHVISNVMQDSRERHSIEHLTVARAGLHPRTPLDRHSSGGHDELQVDLTLAIVVEDVLVGLPSDTGSALVRLKPLGVLGNPPNLVPDEELVTPYVPISPCGETPSFQREKEEKRNGACI
ncbi:hypothetical protein FH972_006071 [Carpinus fangiana]|uniref:Uncharacterized protein n=1 Tax=Carpinus fangiana TaxID=176857 RepID=A0A5N6QR65_9ROSI|nr:hypothetical protein FH972_006071 [Carpinus fangiana]